MEKEKKEASLLERITTLAEKRGFFFRSSEIYPDASAGFFEYGPNGVALKNNIISMWRKSFVKKDNMLEIDGSQIMPRSVFQASGHLTSFADPLVQCEKCKFIARADKLIQEKTKKLIPERLKLEEYDRLIQKHSIACPKCKSKLSKTRFWNMMFKLGIGPGQKEAYLRPETCQSIFIDFPRLFLTSRIKIPIAIAQLGKSFRNEVSPRQSILRTREFTQTEIEVFFNPKKTKTEKFTQIKNYKLRLMQNNSIKEILAKDAIAKKIISSELIAYYLALLQQFYESLGIPKQKMRFRKLGDEEKAFYAKEAWDFEVFTSMGWLELVACNNRGDYDLSNHAKLSKQNFHVMDENEKVLPHIFELSMGIDRTLYTLLDLAYEEQKLEKETRTVLHLPPKLAPIQVAIFPLVNKDGLPQIAKKIYNELKENFSVFYDYSGSIGKMYRRQDEVGTKMSVTTDYQTIKDKTITLRDRDSMKQIRIKISKLKEELSKILQ